MKVGIPKEIKNNENRVAITPAGVHALTKCGHQVIVEKGAGLGSGISDEQYISAGAVMEAKVADLFSKSDIIVKVKEPLASEYDYFKEGQVLFTYLHLAPNPSLTKALLDKKVTGIAYETICTVDGALPLLSPMSEVAGRMAVLVGANLLLSYHGGEGVLISGVTGVPSAEVVVIGGGIVGTNAIKLAVGLGAHVTVFDVNKKRLAYLDDLFFGKITTMVYSEYDVAEAVKKADLLIGAVLVAGASAPKTVSIEMVKTMKKGSVIVDVAIDQGGSIETIDHATTHDNPSYEKFGVIHYSVANMPGAVPYTSTYALDGSTLPYLLELVNKGPKKAMLENSALLKGLNTHNGQMTCQAAAESLGLPYVDPKIALQ